MPNPVAELLRQFLFFNTDTDDRLRDALRRIRHLERDMANIHDLIQLINEKVSTQNSVIEGVRTLLSSTSQALKDAQAQIASSGDVTLLTDIANGLDQHNAALAAAVAANTPAASDPTPSTPAEPVTTDTPLEPVSSGDSSSASDSSTGATTENPTPSEPASTEPTAENPAPTDGNSSETPNT